MIICACIPAIFVYLLFVRRKSWIMAPSYFISMILIFILNVCFFISGICLNSLVILSIQRSSQLRKKLCHFMVMILSCFDLLVAITNHPLIAYLAILWLYDENEVHSSPVVRFINPSSIFIGLSLLVLLVLNVDRYLATYHPLFHRNSVTKKRLLALLGIFIFFLIVLLSMYLNFVITFRVAVLIFLVIFTPPLLLINYKLLKITKKNRMSPEVKKTFSLKSVSSCVLAVVCFGLLSIPSFINAGLRINSKENDVDLVTIWTKTIGSMNGTFNCLIFYWKNKILRVEGMKFLKDIKRMRR